MSNNKRFIFIGVLLSMFLAGGVSFYASSNPDGLEKVAGDIGFLESAKEHTNADGPLADYSVKGVENSRLAGGLAGLIGVGATALVGGLVFTLLSRKPDKSKK
jgi:cobalt/nickel transport protein